MESLLRERVEQNKRFWRGEGPCLILIPPAKQPLYDTADYETLFHNPEAMWKSEVERARPLLDWPTDGIPTVRPNLGVVFVPSIAGLGYELHEGQMPWPGEPLDVDTIRAARNVDITTARLMRLAREFYQIHSESDQQDIVAYHADTQGVFDIAHMLYGDGLFYDLADPDKAQWIDELMNICLDLYVRTSLHLKALLGQDASSMIHGHGRPQGVHFPHAGVRTAEDTPTLLSPAMIERAIVPFIQRAVEPFGSGFLHFCGHHPFLFERMCGLDLIRAIDLGNPEKYDTRWLLDRCAETDTVLFSMLGAEDGETWEVYVRRIAGLVRETGARCILQPCVFPQSREECSAMRDLWHELTER